MSMNVNTNYKAQDAGTTATDPVTTDSSTGASSTTDPAMAQLLAEVQQAIADIEQWKLDNADILEEMDDATLSNIERIYATLKAEAVAIPAMSTLSATGGSPAAGGANAWDPQKLVDGWNPPEYISTDPDPNSAAEAAIEGDTAKYGDYAGTMRIPSGNPSDPKRVGFQMTDDMTSVTVESHGRDLIFTVGYDKDGDGKEDSRESYVIKNGTMQQGDFIISARGLTHGVTIDLTQAIRVDSGTASGKGFIIIGSDKDDVIKGSGSDDGIVGGLGADQIDGGFGDDTIYGDEGPGADGANGYIAGNFDEAAGGDDDINGGAGSDIIYAQGGNDDTVYTSDVKDKGGSVMEAENTVDNVTGANPGTGTGWLESPNGEWEEGAEEDGMVVYENTSDTNDAGEIVIDMSALPPGYTMAYGEMSADNDLILTFVNSETGETFKLKIKDFFSGSFGDNKNPSTAIPHLVINGTDENDIIDMSRVKINEGNQQGQCIEIHGMGGDDIILGPQNKMLKDGVAINAPLDSTVSNGTLNDYVNDGVFATDDNADKDGHQETGDGYHSEVKDGQIYITDDTTDDATNPDGPAEKLNIVAPDGYDWGYITQDQATGDMYVVLVKTQESGKADTIVIRIDKSLTEAGGGKLGFGDISIKHRKTDNDSWGESLPLTPFSMDDDAYSLDGGDGSDLYFAQKGSDVLDDGKDDTVEVDYGTSYVPSSDVPVSGSSDTGGSSDPDPADDPTTQDPTTTDMSDSDYKKWAEAKHEDDIDTDNDGTISSDEWDAWLADNPNPHGKST